MAQNIYDDDGFFAAYAGLPRSVGGLDAAPEWPTLRAMLPDVAGARVVDLGCGYGWFCRWAAGAGAASVLGIDLSEKMLARARSDDPASPPDVITYERQDLDALDLAPVAFDLAYSSLALHYLVHLDRILATVHDALTPGGSLVVSAEHPVYTAPSAPGFTTGPGDRPTWPIDGYLDEGPRTTDWLAPGVVKQHRTIETYLRLVRDAGFVLTDLIEWGPSPDQVATEPDWAGDRVRPIFLLLAAHRA